MKEISILSVFTFIIGLIVSCTDNPILQGKAKATIVLDDIFTGYSAEIVIDENDVFDLNDACLAESLYCDRNYQFSIESMFDDDDRTVLLFAPRLEYGYISYEIWFDYQREIIVPSPPYQSQTDTAYFDIYAMILDFSGQFSDVPIVLAIDDSINIRFEIIASSSNEIDLDKVKQLCLALPQYNMISFDIISDFPSGTQFLILSESGGNTGINAVDLYQDFANPNCSFGSNQSYILAAGIIIFPAQQGG